MHETDKSAIVEHTWTRLKACTCFIATHSRIHVTRGWGMDYMAPASPFSQFLHGMGIQQSDVLVESVALSASFKTSSVALHSILASFQMMR